ncbi:MAG: hypothetical protein BGP06_16075 [Rhizobiales bacterium 65-9]|nr:hypothetical protein [Hyphomicrobiales bacterium]OJY37986.1 MAG: hypothetical protein BGP06_16075 [Rhizobiales bacterium 65-9]
MGAVIAWPGPSAKAAERRLDDKEPRGQILFFTGVRYERHDDANRPTGADPSAGASGAQRRRRNRA